MVPYNRIGKLIPDCFRIIIQTAIPLFATHSSIRSKSVTKLKTLYKLRGKLSYFYARDNYDHCAASVVPILFLKVTT
jgi:hypothetical protein